jgi:hypothetical protein
MVAGGHVTALVAAGAQAIAKLRSDPIEDLAARLDKLEIKEREALVAAISDAKARFDAIRPAKVEESAEAIVADGIYEAVEPHLVSILEKLLADSVAFSFRAQGYHWNVKGANFPQYHDMFGEDIEIDESASAGLQKKASESGVPLGILKQVYRRGVAAWRTGHRPGTTPQQWGMARVNSYITKGKTYHTTDKDLRESLWANIHKKRREGRPMRKPGSKGAPTDAAFKSAKE